MAAFVASIEHCIQSVNSRVRSLVTRPRKKQVTRLLCSVSELCVWLKNIGCVWSANRFMNAAFDHCIYYSVFKTHSFGEFEGIQ